MDKSTKEETLDFNIRIIEQQTGQSFGDLTVAEKERVVAEHRAAHQETTKRIMDEGYQAYTKNKAELDLKDRKK